MMPPARAPLAGLAAVLLAWVCMGQIREPAPGPAPAPIPVTEEQLRLQVYLDQHKFRPGKLDGRQGEFTDKALVRMAQANKKSPEQIKEEARTQSTPLYTQYTIRESDFNFVGTLPDQPTEMAKLKFLPYRSLGEFVAERYHTDLEYLKTLNSGVDLNRLRVGTQITVPAVEPFVVETIYPETLNPQPRAKAVSKGKEKEKAARVVKIHRSEHMLEVWEKDRLLAAFPISVGPPENETPAGDLSIQKTVLRPNFRQDEKMLKEGIRSEEAHLFPPGPNNPVGVMWNQTSRDGIGLHGTNDPDLIGRNLSSGCVRLSNWDVVALSELLPADAKLIID